MLHKSRQKPTQSKAGLGTASTSLQAKHRQLPFPIEIGEVGIGQSFLALARITHQGFQGTGLPNDQRTTLLHDDRWRWQALQLGFIHLQHGGPKPHQVTDRRQLDQGNAL